MFGNFGLLDLGTPELLIILAILLLLFGGAKLPQLTKGLGESMRELRKGFTEDIHEDQAEKKPADNKKPTA